MAEQKFQKGQKIKYTNSDNKVEYGVFSHYSTVYSGSKEAVFAYWGGNSSPTWVDVHEVESAMPESNSSTINHDIIKLIELGYEFKTFWGTTFDGKEFHIEVEDQSL